MANTSSSTVKMSRFQLAVKSLIIFFLASLVITFSVALNQLFLDIKDKFVKESNKLYSQLIFTCVILGFMVYIIIMCSYSSTYQIDASQVI